MIRARVIYRGLGKDAAEAGETGGEEEGGEEGQSSRVSEYRGGGFPQPTAIDRKFVHLKSAGSQNYSFKVYLGSIKFETGLETVQSIYSSYFRES